MAALRSLIFLLFQIVTVIPYAFLTLLWSPLPLRWRYRLTMGWPKLVIWGARVILGIRWRVIGADNFPDGPAIVLAKHQSAWETLFLPAYLPRPACFVYKKELNYLPFFGWGLATLSMIPIDRSKGRDAFDQVVRLGKQRLQEGRWPVLFPEGTRVPVGKMGRFKAGGATLAARTGAPVIPIAHNAGECWPRNAFIKRPGLITVSVGPLIPTQGLSPDAINQQVQAWIAQEMQRLNPEHHDAAGSRSTDAV